MAILANCWWQEDIFQYSYQWATSWQNQQKDCTCRRLSSAWASTQSDQSSLSIWRSIGSLATHWVHSEDKGHFVGFVVRRLRYKYIKSWAASWIKVTCNQQRFEQTCTFTLTFQTFSCYYCHTWLQGSRQALNKEKRSRLCRFYLNFKTYSLQIIY